MTASWDGDPLIEDEDGAPLPEYLQRGGTVYETVLGWLTDPGQPIARHEVEEWPKRTTDDLMVYLAPVLRALPPVDDVAEADAEAEALSCRAKERKFTDVPLPLDLTEQP